MQCAKCKEEFEEKAEKNKTYLGIDEHHNPPQFMFAENELWNGNVYFLCRKCHRKLHDEIIVILNEFASTLKFIKSEHWVWIKILPQNRLTAREKVYLFAENFIKGG